LAAAMGDADGAWAAGTRLPTGSDGERIGRLVADIAGHVLLAGVPSARLRGARVPTGPRLVLVPSRWIWNRIPALPGVALRAASPASLNCQSVAREVASRTTRSI